MNLEQAIHNLQVLETWGELDQEFDIALGIALTHLYKIDDPNTYCDSCGEVLNADGKCPWECEQDEQEEELSDEVFLIDDTLPFE